MDNQQPSLKDTRRTCTKCGEEKELTQFNFVGKSPNGKQYRGFCCKDCTAIYNREYSKPRERKEKAKARMRERRAAGLPKPILSKLAAYQRGYRRAALTRVLTAYGNRCACCGEDEPDFLVIDHVNNDGNVARKERLHPPRGEQLYKWLEANDYPRTFQLLCMNCNFGKHRNGGVCPHQEGSTTIPKGSTAQAIGAGSAKPLH